jgi:excisionase family DNA binding protein
MTERTPLWTAEQVSEYLQVPVATLYQWKHKGTGPRASRVGRHLRYRSADVELWLDAQSQGGAVA